MRKLLALALALVVAGPAIANTIDQNQPSGPVYMAGFAQGDLAQSFQQSNTNMSGAGILLQAGIGSSDNVIITLYDALPNQGGVVLAQGNAQGTQGQWVDVFWPAVPVTPGVTYFIVFTGNTSLGITGDTNNPYPYGQVYANTGFGSFPNFDYAFRTYYDEGGTPTEETSWGSIKALYAR